MIFALIVYSMKHWVEEQRGSQRSVVHIIQVRTNVLNTVTSFDCQKCFLVIDQIPNSKIDLTHTICENSLLRGRSLRTSVAWRHKERVREIALHYLCDRKRKYLHVTWCHSDSVKIDIQYGILHVFCGNTWSTSRQSQPITVKCFMRSKSITSIISAKREVRTAEEDDWKLMH